MDTTAANGPLVFDIFAALAEFERELIAERTRAGLAAARAEGAWAADPTRWTRQRYAWRCVPRRIVRRTRTTWQKASASPQRRSSVLSQRLTTQSHTPIFPYCSSSRFPPPTRGEGQGTGERYRGPRQFQDAWLLGAGRRVARPGRLSPPPPIRRQRQVQKTLSHAPIRLVRPCFTVVASIPMSNPSNLNCMTIRLPIFGDAIEPFPLQIGA